MLVVVFCFFLSLIVVFLGSAVSGYYLGLSVVEITTGKWRHDLVNFMKELLADALYKINITVQM